jgi:hypothetical protein
MNILDVISSAQGGAAVRQLGDQFGLAPEQTQSAIAALMPALASGLHQNASSESGLGGLLSALASGGHQQYLESPGSLAQPAATSDGNSILGHILGSKDVSRQVAQRASQQTGISAGTLQQMLPLLAAMTMGGLSSQSAGPGGGLLSMLSPMLDQNRDGSVMDDLMGIAGRLLGNRGNT